MEFYQNYFAIFVFILIGLIAGLVPIGLGLWLGPKKKVRDKLLPYECGFDAFQSARVKFDVRFYLVAILFILFDLELAFLLPLGLVFRKLNGLGILAAFLFLLILTIGLVYEFRKKSLEWE
jgi:NADH-quinone oxidoreductase subunit A